MIAFAKARRLRALGLCLVLTTLLGCSFFDSSGGGGKKRFNPRSTKIAARVDTFIEIDGRWLVFQASEAQQGKNGTDFNKDGDFQDPIGVVVDMRRGGRFRLDVAVEQAAIVQNEIYLVVSEDEDGTDWNTDGMPDDFVLLHWSRSTKNLTFVGTLNEEVDTPIMEVGDRLYFTDGSGAPLGGSMTTLQFVDVAMPTTPMRAFYETTDPVDPRILSADEGLLFLILNERVDPCPAADCDFNGDGDTDDARVLAVYDTTDPAAVIRNIGSAVPNCADCVRAHSTGPGDWLIGFLVAEAREAEMPGDEGTNLNDPALFDPEWMPLQCTAGQEDTDESDDVLHYLNYADFVLGVASPVNTGLAGTDRVFALPGTGGMPGFVATLTDEDDEGDCSLNDDGGSDTDQNDLILRWVRAEEPVRPFTNVNGLLALKSNLSGPTEGVVELDGRFVAVVNEAADGRSWDDVVNTNNDLIAWLDPNLDDLAEWTFDHDPGGGPSYFGIDWMDFPENGRLLITLQESVFDSPLNPGDGDTADIFPGFAGFDPNDPDDMDFPGPPVATSQSQTQVIQAGDWAIFPVRETEDARDWNKDKGINDRVLIRTRLDNPTDSRLITPLQKNNQGAFTDPRLTAGGDVGVAYLAGETQFRKDLNGDGDKVDFVIRWFRL